MTILFRCPFCHAPLADDSLICPVHGAFTRSPYGFISFLTPQSGYFSDHWIKNKLSELPLAKISTAETFLKPLLAQPPGTWLDVGTGDGVHLRVISSHQNQAKLVGLDISSAALASCHQRVPEATLMLADSQTIPLCDGAVDAAFSFGVLAYVPDPWKALAEMVRVTRRGGLVGIWIYPRTKTLLGYLLALVRKVVPRLPRLLQNRMADCIVPLLRLLPTASGMHLGNASWSACREVVLVNIAPPHLIFPTPNEVRAQITALGCRVVKEDTDQPITLWAEKE